MLSLPSEALIKGSGFLFKKIRWPGFNPVTHFTTPWAETLVLFLLFPPAGFLEGEKSFPAPHLQSVVSVSFYTCFPWVCLAPDVRQVFPPFGHTWRNTGASCHQMHVKSIQHLWAEPSAKYSEPEGPAFISCFLELAS